MATKKSSSATKITRISASGKSTKPSAKSEKVAKETTKKPRVKRETKRRNPLRAIGGYFAGAWRELREVHWPTRRATWGMVGALLAFTAFFVVIILLLDAGFQSLFNLLLGS